MNSVKIRSAVLEYVACRQTDGQTDMTKLMGAIFFIFLLRTTQNNLKNKNKLFEGYIYTNFRGLNLSGSLDPHTTSFSL
jgi:hypothetical protein